MTTVDVPSRILRIDLSNRTVESESIPPRWRQRYLGGKGLGARYLYEELEPGVDPLGEDNVLCLFRGPFSGYLPGETRYAAITKSPLTGIFVDSYSGGDFAGTLLGALGDHLGLLIEGQATEPVELHLEAGEVSIQSATEKWGLDTESLATSIDSGEVAGIGPAGERLVRYATIATDGGDHHAGRGGTGAVMGSKRLKAIIAQGEPPADHDLKQMKARYEDRFESDPRGRWHQSSGTVETVDAADVAGVLPTHGWQKGTFEDAEEIGAGAVKSAATGREGRPPGIPGDFDIDGTVPRGGLGIALGANLGIGDMEDVVKLGRRCDEVGLDIIEAGNALAWAMLANEQGITDHEVTFGDAEAARRLLDDIAERSTLLGDYLADGIDTAADNLGGEALVPTVKSMAVASYDPRPAPSMALAFATSDRGACHRRSRPVFDELFDTTDWSDTRRAELVINEQNLRSLLWCYIVDDLTAPAFEEDLGIDYVESIGLDLAESDLRDIGERVWTLTRLFNVREGMTASDDRLPAAFEVPLEGGPTAGATIDPTAFETLRQEYYRQRSWDSTGRPTRELLERLDLLNVVDDPTLLADEPAARSDIDNV